MDRLEIRMYYYINPKPIYIYMEELKDRMFYLHRRFGENHPPCDCWKCQVDEPGYCLNRF